jgi:hypothetical protein
MSFTYDPEQLSSSKLYQVRLSIGQTNQYDLVVLQDEEIKYFLSSSYDVVNDASIKAIDAMISRAGSFVDKQTGQTQENASQLIDNLIKLRNDILTSVARNVPIYAGFTGFLEADRIKQQEDDEIYHDGLTMRSEDPDTFLLNGPIINTSYDGN